jgi:hypothetical protein
MKNKNNKSRKKKGGPIAKSKSKVIAFRLGETDLGLLAERASEEGRSICQMAGDLVVAALHHDGHNELEPALEHIAKVDERVSELREDLALVTEVLLTNAGKRSADEASSWVDSNLKPEQERE